jgi:hypothetical protein
MNAETATAFVIEHGIVLVSARGPLPRLTEFITGESITGSWWAHAKSHEIYRVLQALEESPDILVCRLVGGHVTLVHRRLWPALVKMAAHFHPGQLAQVRQEHTAAGKHVNRSVAYPSWVPREVSAQAKLLSDREARGLLASVLGLPYPAKRAGTRGTKKRGS